MRYRYLRDGYVREGGERWRKIDGEGTRISYIKMLTELSSKSLVGTNRAHAVTHLPLTENGSHTHNSPSPPPPKKMIGLKSTLNVRAFITKKQNEIKQKTKQVIDNSGALLV